MDILNFAGNPPFNYEMLLGLWANASRAETRIAYRTLRAVRDSFPGFHAVIPEEYFKALYDTKEEATAMHALHASRCSEPPHEVAEG